MASLSLKWACSATPFSWDSPELIRVEPVVVQELGVAAVQGPPRLRRISWVAAEVLSERITRGLPPNSQRAFCRPCFRARKVSPVATSA